jgi:hypothetical protein
MPPVTMKSTEAPGATATGELGFNPMEPAMVTAAVALFD